MHALRKILPFAMASALWAQAPVAAPEFDAASVKPSAPLVPGRVTAGLRMAGSQLTCTALSLRDYIKFAFDRKDYQIDGPDWIATERFDIAAKLPGAVSRDQVRPMMRKLLEDRFKLAVHRGSKELPVYALILGKTPLKLTEVPLDAETEIDSAGRASVNVNASGGRSGTEVTFGRGSSFSISGRRLDLKKMNLAIFADVLARFVDRPVVDMTGLKATYDFSLDFNQDDLGWLVRSAVAEGSAPPEALHGFENLKPDTAPSIFDSLQKVGLKLEPRKAPLETLVIDHLEKLPTDN